MGRGETSMKKQKVKWLKIGRNFYDTNLNNPYYTDGYLAIRVFEKLSLILKLKICWKVLTNPRLIGIVEDSTIEERKLKKEIYEYEERIRKLENNLERIQRQAKEEDME